MTSAAPRSCSAWRWSLAAALRARRQPAPPRRRLPPARRQPADDAAIDEILAGEEEVLEGDGLHLRSGHPPRSVQVAARGAGQLERKGRAARGHSRPADRRDRPHRHLQTASGFVAQVQASNKEKSYLIQEGDQLYDGDVVSIAPDEVVFKQIVNDPTAQAVPRGGQEAQPGAAEPGGRRASWGKFVLGGSRFGAGALRGGRGRWALALLLARLRLGCAPGRKSPSAAPPSAAPARRRAEAPAPPAQITSLQSARGGARRAPRAAGRPRRWSGPATATATGGWCSSCPTAAPGAGVADLGPDGGLVRAVVGAPGRQRRPAAHPPGRSPRRETEYNLASGNTLLLRSSLPAATRAMAVASEPVPVAPDRRGAAGAAQAHDQAPPPAVAPPAPSRPMETTAAAPAAPAVAGTPEAPLRRAGPRGRRRPRASRTSSSRPGRKARRCASPGDGDFAYSTFQLADPARFVIDLQGVANSGARRRGRRRPASCSQRVRVAQFKPQPEPVSRVVFDLAADAVPRIERDRRGLVVRFGRARWPQSLPTDPWRRQRRRRSAAVAETSRAGGMARAGSGGAGARRCDPRRGRRGAAGAGPGTPGRDHRQRPEVAAAPVPAPATPRPPPRLEPSDVGALEAVDVQDVRRDAPTQRQPTQAPGFRRARSATAQEGVRRRADQLQPQRRRHQGRAALLRQDLPASTWSSSPASAARSRSSSTACPGTRRWRSILKINNLGYELEGNIMRIAPRATLADEAQEQQTLQRGAGALRCRCAR